MIHLYSNIYVTYFETVKPPNFSYGVIVGSEDRSSNFEGTTYSPKIGRYLSHQEVFSDMHSFEELYNKSRNGEDKIVVYMDEPNFKEFIVRWLKSGYNKADQNKLYQIYKFYGDCELTKTNRIEFSLDDNKKCPNPRELIKGYWDLSKEEFTAVYNSFNKFDFPLEVFRTLGYELMLTNAILGSRYYQEKVKDRVYDLYVEEHDDVVLSKQELYDELVSGRDDMIVFDDLYEKGARFNTFLVALAIKTKDKALFFGHGNP